MRYLAVILLSAPIQFILMYYRPSIDLYIHEIIQIVSTKIDEYTRTTDQNLNNTLPVLPTIETKRPEKLWFRVGEVVWNPEIGYTGVIIGWNIQNDTSTSDPLYEILVNHPDIPDYKTKSPQNKLYLLKNTQIQHPELTKYFDWYNISASQYIPKPWLRARYPSD